MNGSDALELGDLDLLYAEFARPLKRIVRGGVRASDDVIEDACQAAWTRLLRHRHRIPRTAAEGWLTRTALREALRLWHKRLREPPLDLVVEVRLAPEPQQLLEQWQRLDAVSALPRRQQRLVWLRALGLSYEEMASHECCTSRTVERQLEGARRRLRAVDGSLRPGQACAIGVKR